MPSTAIKSYLPSIPKTPGIYQFFDEKDRVLYVGKAKNLQKRITSYTKENQLSARIARMVFLAQKVEIIQTENEVEALLLEHNLIKKLEPRFNILLRDDKTFPQILITDHFFPQITKYRGQRFNNSPLEEGLKSVAIRGENPSSAHFVHRSSLKGRMAGKSFGPFASGHDVNHTIDVLRKSFLLRNCSDNEFKSRRKPCLEYQIKKCSAPCVSLISQEEYAISVQSAIDFLSGKSAEVQKDLTQKMQGASASQNYEKAAQIRDQIKALNSIQAKQNINVDELKNFDSIVATAINDIACIHISFYRVGQNYGSKPYFFEIEEGKNLNELLAEFLGQFYLSQSPPPLILANCELDEKKLIEEFLSRLIDKKVEILIPKKGAKLALLKDQEQLAIQNLEQKILQNLNNKELLLEVKKIFDLPKIPQRIEVYDNSHTGGTNAVGTLITAGVDGFIKSGYRKFNIRFEEGENHANTTTERHEITTHRDDTAMLREVLTRRFSKIKKEEWPDFIIIDGGKPQLSAAQKVFDKLEIKIPFVCMSKGEDRNAGKEFFHRTNKESFTLEKHAPVMHYLQRLRDEAHRFAIMTHRKKRNRAMIS